MGFVVDKVTLGRFFPEYFGFPLSVSFHWCSVTWKRTKNNHLHLYHRVVQEALRLRCARSVCCGALHHYKNLVNYFLERTLFTLTVGPGDELIYPDE
jgi:hypothetical protein